MNRTMLTVLLASTVMLLPSTLFAGSNLSIGERTPQATLNIERLITYQGIIKDPTGHPVSDGDYPVIFRIYDSGIGGSALWSSPPAIVHTTDWHLFGRARASQSAL